MLTLSRRWRLEARAWHEPPTSYQCVGLSEDAPTYCRSILREYGEWIRRRQSSPSILTALGAVEAACRPSQARTVALATIISDHQLHARKIFLHAKKECSLLVACVMHVACACLRMRIPNGGFRHPILSGIFP